MRREWVQGRSGVVTQLRYAREGVIAEEMRHVAEREGLAPEKVRGEIAAGRLIIPANIRHTNLEPIGIGSVCRCKVNANIGNSSEQSDAVGELEKLDVAQRYGADTVMDLSTGGDINQIRAAILEKCTVPLGTVPVYQAIHGVEDVAELSARDFLDVIRGQAEQGVDYVTVHVGILREHLPLVQKRVNGIVSRGGSLMATWMLKHNAENPLYTQYDALLDICAEYDVSLSLGDGLRPGCLADASDEAQFAELKVLGDLTRRAWARDVQVMVEGPGHIPLNEIEMNVRKQQEYCDNAPFYLLGPLVTDIAAGYDHITSAIGGAIAATAGASMLCYVTPMEHLGLPDAEAVREGIIAHRIAAHAADIARGLPGARKPDDEMALARFHFDWEKQFELALDPERARKIRSAHLKGEDEKLDDYCTMCGPKFCAMKISKDLCADVVAHHKAAEEV